MAQTVIQQADSATLQAWREGITHEVERNVVGMNFLEANNPDAAFQLIDDLNAKRGYQVTTKFSPTEDFDGISDTDNVYANARAVKHFTDTIALDYLGAPFGGPSIMSQQRVNFDIKQSTFFKAAAWWRRRFETSIWNQMTGNTVANSSGSRYEYGGMNSITALDSAHLHSPGGTAAESLASTDKIELSLIDDLVTMAMADLDYPIAPASDGHYHLAIHPYQWRDLRKGTSTGDWQDIQLSRLKGGQDYNDSHLSRGTLGFYNNTLIHVTNSIPLSVNSGDSTAAVTSTRRACFFGAQAGAMVFGEDFAANGHLHWSEEVSDHNKWSLLVSSVFGFKRTIYNSQTYGAIGLDTYAAAS